MTPRLRALSAAVIERAVVVWKEEMAVGLTPEGAMITVLSEVLPLHAYELVDKILRDAGEWDGWPEKQAAMVYAASLIRPREEA